MNMKHINLTLILIIVISLALLTIGFGGMSVLEDADNPYCISDIGGGECNLLVKLPTGEKLDSGFSFDIDVHSIPDLEFSEEIELNAFVHGGPYYEKSSLTRFYNENSYPSLYFIPDEYYNNPYQVKIRTEATATGRMRSDGRLYMRLEAGYIRNPYMSSEVEICDFQDNSDCLLINNYYVYRSYIYETRPVIGTGQITRIAYDANSLSLDEDDPQTTRLLKAEGIINGNVIPKDNAVIYVQRQIAEKYYSASSKSFAEPKLYTSYKENHLITNLRVMIGDQILKIYPGITEDGRIYLPDMSNEINDYCGRNIGLDRECLVYIKFITEDGGKISIASELGKLIPIPEPIEINNTIDPTLPDNDFDFGVWGITGWVSLDFKNNPVNTSFTIIVVGLVVGLIIFFIYKKVKK